MLQHCWTFFIFRSPKVDVLLELWYLPPFPKKILTKHLLWIYIALLSVFLIRIALHVIEHIDFGESSILILINHPKSNSGWSLQFLFIFSLLCPAVSNVSQIVYYVTVWNPRWNQDTVPRDSTTSGRLFRAEIEILHWTIIELLLRTAVVIYEPLIPKENLKTIKQETSNL